VEGAIDYLVQAEHEHPNRLDIIRDSNSGPQTGVFSRDNAPKTSLPFGGTTTPAFGAPSQPSAFGAPSQLVSNPFGVPSQSNGFGQPSALGQRPNSFGAPSQPGGTSAFGQSSALGQKSNPFGAPSNSGGSNFGQPSGALGAPSQPPANPFGASPAFGAPSQPGANPNPFGQPPSNNPFAASPPPANPFGAVQHQSTPAASNPFGGSSSAQPTAFGAPSQPPANPFGQSSQPAVSNPFGTPAPAMSNPFGPSSSAPINPFGDSTTKPPSTSSPFRQVNGNNSSGYVPSTGGGVTTYISKDNSGRLMAFKGKRVQYKNSEPGYIGSDGSWSRIFFPDGPPSHTTQTTTDINDQYDGATEAAYKRLLETGEFANGEIPLLPPKKEWVRWDF